MKGNSTKIGLIILLLLAVPICFAQSSKTLKQRRNKTLRQIEFTKKILRETKSKKTASLNTLNTVQSLIETRQDYIAVISEEITLLNAKIKSNKTTLDAQKAKLEQEKKRLGNLIYTIYKTKSAHNRIAFVLSASSFNDAMRRLDYMNQIAKHETKFIQNIKKRNAEIELSLQLLEDNKIQKDSVLSLQEAEKINLLKDKEVKQAVVQSLQGKEKELKDKLKDQQRIAANLNNAIKKAIAREIAIARKKKEAERRKREAERRRKEAARKKRAEEAKSLAEKEKIENEEILLTTPEDNRLEKTFLANKGKLPWPVLKGFISERFGRKEHESLAGIVIENNGIDITTPIGVTARSIFEGEVSAIMDIPGMGTTVLISHGNYFTVYAKLKTVRVSQGDKVSIKQSIGQVMTDNNGKTAIHLEIWQGQSKQNPALWLMRR